MASISVQLAKIKVFVRLRPNLATDVHSGECLNIKDTTHLSIKRDGEISRSFDCILSDLADQAALWEAVGSPAIAAIQAGEMSSITVYGQHGSGKTYALFGENDGLCNRLVRDLAGNSESNLCVLLIRNEQIQDLANPKLDNLKVKVDDTSGVAAEGATTVRIPNAEAGFEHIKKCVATRDSILEQSNSSDFLVFTIYIFGCGTGQLCVIECCASDRVYRVEMTEDEKKELVAKNKALSLLRRCWLDSAINSDPKGVGWKDTKVTRFIQPGLSFAMDGKGFAALLVTVVNQKEHVFETMSTLAFAESSVKQESLKSISEYKEILAYLEERLETSEKVKNQLVTEMKVQEGNAARVKAENAQKLLELDEKSKELDVRVQQTKAQCAQELERLKKEHEKKKIELKKKNEEELDRMRNLSKNAPAQAEADIKKRVAEMEAEHKEKMSSMRKELETLQAETKENKELLQELRDSATKREADLKKAMEPVKALEAELAKLEAQLRVSGKSREDGLSPEEIAEKEPLWQARDELDDLEEEVAAAAKECLALENAVANGVGKPAASEVSSDVDSDESSEKSGSSAKSSEESEESSESEDDEAVKAALAAKVAAEMEAAKKEEEQRKVDRESYDREWSHFRDTIRKDQFLQELLEKVLQYLEYGTNITTLNAKGVVRQFFYILPGRKGIALVDEVRAGGAPNKKQPLRTIVLDQVEKITMGQHSTTFQTLLKKLTGRSDPPRDEAPPPPEEICVNNLHRYYYRSFTLTLKDESTFECIADSATDFEALIVAVHRLTQKDACWGKKLYIEFCEDIDKLEAFERAFCEECHLTPKEYLSAKEKILMSEDRLFLALHDIRTVAGLDLFHSQKLLELFLKQKWIVRRQLYYFKYQEKTMASAQAAQERAAARMGGATATDNASAPPPPAFNAPLPPLPGTMQPNMEGAPTLPPNGARPDEDIL